MYKGPPKWWLSLGSQTCFWPLTHGGGVATGHTPTPSHFPANFREGRGGRRKGSGPGAPPPIPRPGAGGFPTKQCLVPTSPQYD